MIPDLAKQLCAYGIPKNGAEAEDLLRVWLRGSPDKQVDRYGNYIWTGTTKSGEELLHRYHFAKTVMRHETKFPGGEWSSRSSTLFQDAALNLLALAAKESGSDAFAARVQAALDKRTAGKADRVVRKESKELAEAKTVWAWKRIAYEAWEDFRKLALEMDMDAGQKELDRLTDARQVFEDEYVERWERREVVEADGSTPAGGDPVFASADKPPLLPFVSSRFKYVWAQASGGSTFSVQVEQGTQKNEIYIQIGSPPGGLALDARGRVKQHWTGRLLGAQYLTGRVNVWDAGGKKQLLGEITFPGALAGREEHAVWIAPARALWEKILRSYQVPHYRTDSPALIEVPRR
jgi:hypothetical protein